MCAGHRLASYRGPSPTRKPELTYAEHGATAGIMPSGYHHDRWEADLGSFSPDRFDRPAESLWHWQVQLSAGMTVFPAGQGRSGLTFALAIRMPAT